MNRLHSRQRRILAIAPSNRGFGFVILEDQETLVDWGVKTVSGDKNAQSLLRLEEMISHYGPSVLVLEDPSAKGSRRSPRVRALGQQVIALASRCKLKLALLTREKVRRAFFADGEGTKHALAKILAERFPEQLGFRLPPKRRPWMSADYRMDIFDAVALGLAFVRPNDLRAK